MITYEDKQNTDDSIPSGNWRAVDANEVKTEVNANITATGNAASAANAAQSDINTHEALTNNPHSVTKSQVGLANADNTSDANKPVSTAAQTALNLKLDSILTIKSKDDSHTMDANDLADINAGKYIIFEMTKATPNNFTVPDNATQAIPVGAKWGVMRTGAGTVTSVAGGSMVITSTSLLYTDPGLNVLVEYEKTATNAVKIQNGLPNVSVIAVVPILINTAALVSTNAPNSEQGMAAQSNLATKFDSTNYNYVRLIARVNTFSASVNNPRLYPQYDPAETMTAFTTVGAGTVASGEAIDVSTVGGFKTTSWIALDVNSKADLWWRVGENGGNGTADPAYSSVYLQFKT